MLALDILALHAVDQPLFTASPLFLFHSALIFDLRSKACSWLQANFATSQASHTFDMPAFLTHASPNWEHLSHLPRQLLVPSWLMAVWVPICLPTSLAELFDPKTVPHCGHLLTNFWTLVPVAGVMTEIVR